MENNYINYPKSLNHKILWGKKDKIKTCDLSNDCKEMTISISELKNNKNLISLSDDFILDTLPVGYPKYYETFGSSGNFYNIINFDYILYLLIIILIVILVLIYRNKK